MSSTVSPKEEILDVLAPFSIIPSFICKVSDTRGDLSIQGTKVSGSNTVWRRGALVGIAYCGIRRQGQSRPMIRCFFSRLLI